MSSIYSTARRLFTCRGELPSEGLPPMVEMIMDAFGVRCSMRTVLRVDQVSHLEGVTPSVWQSIPYKRVGKEAEGGRDLTFQGITFVSTDGAAPLLDIKFNIAESSQLIFPLLVGRASLLEEMLDWIQFTYTVDRTGAYMAPASTVLFPPAVSKGDPLFP